MYVCIYVCMYTTYSQCVYLSTASQLSDDAQETDIDEAIASLQVHICICTYNIIITTILY